MNTPNRFLGDGAGIEANRMGMKAFTTLAKKATDIYEIDTLLSGANLLVISCIKKAEEGTLGTGVNFMDPDVRRQMYLLEQYINQ